MEPNFSAPEAPRYTGRPLPPYRYLPGTVLPHPRSDPAGHSYGEDEEYLPTFGPEEWRTCEPYLYGVDLFNQGYWWEAHEAWEGVWLAAGRGGTEPGAFVQGLIQLAAAQLKRLTGEARGARSLTAAGREKLARQAGVYLGIDAPLLVETARRCLDEDRGEFPRILLHF